MANRDQQSRTDDVNQPTGTSGRHHGDMNSGRSDNTDARRNDTSTPGRTRVDSDDDEDSGLGNRTINR